jgi:hypothetical protein
VYDNSIQEHNAPLFFHTAPVSVPHEARLHWVAAGAGAAAKANAAQIEAKGKTHRGPSLVQGRGCGLLGTEEYLHGLFFSGFVFTDSWQAAGPRARKVVDWWRF